MLLIFELLIVFLHLICDYLVSIRQIFYRGKAKSVEGQVVVITGAGSGLGRLVSIKLAKLGAKVIGWDINEKGLKETRDLIEKAVGKESSAFEYFLVDITDRDKVYKTASAIEHPVDILINNAGIVTKNNYLTEKDDVGIVKTFEVNVISHFWTVKSFLPSMMQRNRGHIVTIASVAGYNGAPRLSDYSASKFAAIGFHESLQCEIDARGFSDCIFATMVCPYLINTGMFEGCIENRISMIVPILEPEYVAQKIVNGILYNEKQVVIPKISGLIVAFKYLMPATSWSRVMDMFGANTVFTNLVGRATSQE